MKKYHALIPARGGSKGIKGKNIKPLVGKPLIQYTIESALDSGIFDTITVSTDSKEIANAATSINGCDVYMRSKVNSHDTAHMFPVYKEFVEAKANIDDDDILFILLPTNPLRSAQDISMVHNEYNEDPTVEWVFSCNEMEHHPYRAVRLNSKNNQMMSFFPLENKVIWSNRQELPKAYRFNGAIISGRVKSIRDNSEYPIDSFEYNHTVVKGVITSRDSSYDIDTIEDFEFIEYLISKREKAYQVNNAKMST